MLKETSLMGETYIRLASIFPLFVPAIKDYIDVLNNAYDSVSSDINVQQIIQQSFLFLASSIKFTVMYLVSFQWIQDLSYLPILVPQLKMEILKEHFFLQTPESTFLSFLEIPSYTNNKFVLGILNSFFLCLPLSVAHIVSTRRLLIQGLAAGIASNLGTVLGQILLLICILFGGRFFITPWFTFQAFNYIVGMVLILNTAVQMCTERSIRIIDTSNKSALIKIFLLHFTLAWTEQSCIFQYFGNLTLGAEPTIIEIFSSPTELQSILTHTTYILGIILGSLIFTSFFIFNSLKLSHFVVQFSSMYYSRWIRRLNFTLLILIFTFIFTSIPFYSFDYLVLSNLGFVSQDKSFRNTVFLPTKIYDHFPPTLGSATNFYLGKRPGIDTDVTFFDRGRYLLFDANTSFEQLNYQGEYAWIIHKYKVERIIRDPESYKNLSTVFRFFNKQKKSLGLVSKKSMVYSETDDAIQQKKKQTKKKIKPHKDVPIYVNQNRDPFYSRNEKERKINQFFETMINGNFQNRFVINRQKKHLIVQKKFKQKYYSNPIYKLLLSVDIDFFLSRQPNSFALKNQQENELFQKRLILANYYDSLRYYTTLPYVNDFHDIFHGSKSYADRIYNQQFKGTLKIVRRLFSITLSNSEEKLKTSVSSKNQVYSRKNTKNSINNFILKFDQPLYKKYTINEFENMKSILKHENTHFHPIFHEEFPINRKIHEEFPINKKNKKIVDKAYEKKASTFFIQLTNPIPFYVGWDEQLRKLIITNRLSPRCSAGYSMKFIHKNYSNQYPTLQKIIQKNKTIEFTNWPIPEKNVKNPEDRVFYSYNTLFESLIHLRNKFINQQFLDLKKNPDFPSSFAEIESLPINIAKNGGRMEKKMRDIIPYTRGGFVWPGHLHLQFHFKDFIPNYLTKK